MNPFDLMPSDENAPLRELIAGRIRDHGPITFAEFMDMALYHPVHGYYTTCDPLRDYQSSPNVHPVFGGCVARQVADLWRLLDRPVRFDVVEAGAGSGRLAADIVRWLRREEPDLFEALRYRLQDRTYADAGRREPVLETVGMPESRVQASTEMPAGGELEGCIISNELLDAFPVHRVRMVDGRLRELRVGCEGDRFFDVAGEPSAEVSCYFANLGLLPGEGCEAEVNLGAPQWVGRAASALRRGYVITLDYGYEAPDLYASWRKRGTLLTFYRHTSGEDPYVRVGRQDMTASVDFTSVMAAGSRAGLTNIGLTTQAEFLAALGIGEAIAARPDPTQLEAYYALRRSVIELTDSSGLGRIRVLAQAKKLPEGPLAGFPRRVEGA